MEPAKIDWKTLDSRFVEDELYEHIHAPQWVDFNAPQEFVDDEAWFCRPDCKHPKTVEDFLISTPNSKVLSSADKSETLPLGDWNRRDAKLKRRGFAHQSSMPEFTEDGENQNPNFSTPPHHQPKSMKTKSSSEKKKQIKPGAQKDETPRLKSTLSARNLFAGRDILNQISEFCHELKKLATRAREEENEEKVNLKKSPVGTKKPVVKEVTSEGLNDKERERKPLLEVGKQKSQPIEKNKIKQKLRKKREDEAENIPISLDLKNVKPKEESLLQIRTCPPTPQCFSAARGPNKSTPPKAARSRRMERGLLQEIEQNNKEGDKGNNGTTVSIIAEREAKTTVDMFWFLKPCTLSS
ncbi:hypothetical protein PVL29_017668 [Vitis rotundifolia]|uniref:Uncharacterized protein n=1 Tax=Vitis rotundifolia TaxID=103349 RepID=A0AA39DIS3_VITRO|nr:hypothetical protein PVL29_017668 [Vitis rotundifolia]